MRRKGGIGLGPFALLLLLVLLLVPVGGFDGIRRRRRDLACEYVPNLVVLFVFLGYDFRAGQQPRRVKQQTEILALTNVGVLFDVVAARLLSRVCNRPVPFPLLEISPQLHRLLFVDRPVLAVHDSVRHRCTYVVC